MTTLFARLSRDHASATHETKDSFLKVLNGKLAARQGFDVALAHALRLVDVGGGEADFSLDPAAFEQRLRIAYRPASPSNCPTRKTAPRSDSGRAPPRDPSFRGHCGDPTARCGGRVRLTIDPPTAAGAVAGPILMVGYGEQDRVWQFVSAVTQKPVAPTKSVPWSWVTGVSLSPSVQPGVFALYVVGATKGFPTALEGLFERHRGGDGFLTVGRSCSRKKP